MLGVTSVWTFIYLEKPTQDPDVTGMSVSTGALVQSWPLSLKSQRGKCPVIWLSYVKVVLRA
jgi:hypothetical protein